MEESIINFDSIVKDLYEYVGKHVVFIVEGYIEEVNMKNHINIGSVLHDRLANPVLEHQSTEIKMFITDIEIKE